MWDLDRDGVTDGRTWAENSQSGKPIFGIHGSNHGKVMIFPGGVPLKIGNEVVGGVGVSGGVNKQNQAIGGGRRL